MISAQYSLANVYNMDESSLLYRMGPRNSYLFPSETSLEARGTDLQKQKAIITSVLGVNADGSHTVPVRYIGLGAQPRCLRDSRFMQYKETYTSQKNAWMDGEKFKERILWWYNEVRCNTTDNILLIMDKCG